MGVFLLIVLLLLAAAGILGAVLKVTFVLVVSLALAVAVLAWIGTWYVKRRLRAFQDDLEQRADQQRRKRQAYDVGPDQRSRDLPGG